MRRTNAITCAKTRAVENLRPSSFGGLAGSAFSCRTALKGWLRDKDPALAIAPCSPDVVERALYVALTRT